MQKKYKITGFARFLIFMIFFAPVAYVGASYYNGEDGIANIKNLLGMEDNNSAQTATPTKPDVKTAAMIEMKDQEILMLKSKIEELERQIAENQ